MNFDRYVYPGTDILRNKQGIEDKIAAYDSERRISSMRAIELQRQGITGRFDAAHLQSIHKFLFQDVYDWAGYSGYYRKDFDGVVARIIPLDKYGRREDV